MTVKKKDEDNKKDPIPQPKQKGVPNVFARSLFCWMLPVFWNGNKRDLEEYDLRPTKAIYDSQVVGEKLEINWLQAERESRLTGTKPRLWRVLTKTFILSYWLGGLMLLTSVALRTASPLLFAELLRHWSVDSTMTRVDATYYALGMILANWLASYFAHQSFLLCQQFGMKIRVATSSLMFRK
ncbi:unnamed protein product, partial [Arctia plantaginis]